MTILAIDQGTSATKALVVADDRTVLGAANVPVECTASHDGAAEQDPEALWRSVVDAGREAVARARVRVDAIGLANQGETILAWDRRTGAPLSAAISWQDRRANGICDELRDHAPRLLETTGLPLDPYFAAPKITWLRRHVTSDGVATTTDAWLLHRLTGAFVTDAATASRTALMDLAGTRWSPEACALFGIERDGLPKIVDCADTIGETTAFGDTAPVTGLAVDQQAALFGEGCLRAGDAKCTYGTGAFMLANRGPNVCVSTSGIAASVAWRLGGETTYCLDGQVYTAGAAVDWLRRLGIVGSPDELDALARGAAGRSDVVFVPALAGMAAPLWRPSARAAFVGLTLATGRAEIVAATLEGIAAQVACLARAIADDLGAPLERLRVDGGLTRSAALMQAQADLAQTAVEVHPSADATAFGVAAFARLGIGAARSPEDAVGAFRPARVYEPRCSPAEADERLERWRRVAHAATEL